MVHHEDRGFLLPRSREARLAARQSRATERPHRELAPEDLLGFNPYPNMEADDAAAS